MEQRVVTARFFHRAFTVSCELPTTPVELFSSDFTIHDIEEQARLGTIGANSPPVIVANISYGRMLYVTIKSKETIKALKNAVNASYQASISQGEVGLKEEHKKVLSEAEFSVSTRGGTEDHAISAIKSGKISDFLVAANYRETEPISFVCYNHANRVAAIRDTTHYSITECLPKVADPTGPTAASSLSDLTRRGCVR
jgi:thiol-activated cytolysin